MQRKGQAWDEEAVNRVHDLLQLPCCFQLVQWSIFILGPRPLVDRTYYWHLSALSSSQTMRVWQSLCVGRKIYFLLTRNQWERLLRTSHNVTHISGLRPSLVASETLTAPQYHSLVSKSQLFQRSSENIFDWCQTMLGEDLQWSPLNQFQPIRLWNFQTTVWGLLSDALHVFRGSSLVSTLECIRCQDWEVFQCNVTKLDLTWPWDGHQLWIFTLACSILPLTVNTHWQIPAPY